MTVAHAAHSLLYTAPAAVGLLVLSLLTWRSARVDDDADDGDE